MGLPELKRRLTNVLDVQPEVREVPPVVRFRRLRAELKRAAVDRDVSPGQRRSAADAYRALEDAIREWEAPGARTDSVALFDEVAGHWVGVLPLADFATAMGWPNYDHVAAGTQLHYHGVFESGEGGEGWTLYRL